MSILEDPEPDILNSMADKVIPANTIAQCAIYAPNKALLQLAKSQSHFFPNDDSDSQDQLEFEIVPHPDLLSMGIVVPVRLMVILSGSLYELTTSIWT